MIDLKEYIQDIPDFPQKGIMFRDIQPLLMNQYIFKETIKKMGNITQIPDYWVGIESRGFIFASALSYKFGGGLRLVRKPGKLPNQNLVSVSYNLEYGNDRLEMGVYPNDSGTCVIVDDVLATGGTIDAVEKLCKEAGLTVIDRICLIDIGISPRTDVKALVHYEP
jgi:adenine phosphoribosyltransferase